MNYGQKYSNRREKGGEAEGNCAKNHNSNFCTINQMSHIQLFFHQCLPQFFIQLVTPKLTCPSFLNQNSADNIFDLTMDLILSSHKCLSSPGSSTEEESVALKWLISYQNLKNESDNEVIRLLKSKLKYVHVQMMQILIRLLLCLENCQKDKEIKNTTLTYIQQIGYIYPALKIEVSFDHPDINLVNWFDHIFMKIVESGEIHFSFKIVLQKLSSVCSWIGPLQKVVLKHSSKIKGQVVRKDPEVVRKIEMRNERTFSRDNASQRQSSVSCDKKPHFDESQIFRRKKKMIVKQRFKTNPTDIVCKTPSKTNLMHQNSPTTEMTSLAVHSDTTEHNASSLLYRKMINQNKTFSRTIFFGQTKKFVPKSATLLNPQNYIENMTAPSFKQSNTNTFQQIVRQTSRKPSRMMEASQCEDQNMFGVPATPKKQDHRKLYKTFSTDMSSHISSLKN